MRKHDTQRSRVYAWEIAVFGVVRLAPVMTLEDLTAYVERIWRAERGHYGLAGKSEPAVARFTAVLMGLCGRHLGSNVDSLMAAADALGVRYHARSIGRVDAAGELTAAEPVRNQASSRAKAIDAPNGLA